MIRVGPAGPGGLSYIKALEGISCLGLSAMEVEFTYGVRMTNDAAKEIGKLADRLDISLSVHAPYYINLSSKEKNKIRDSKKRIIDSCERAHYLGARYVVFHAGFYQDRSAEETYKIIKKGIEELLPIIRKNKWKVDLAPEVSGKRAQFGSLEEVLRLRKETGSEFCVDFAHLEAREGKGIDCKEIFDKLKGIKHIHSHLAGIEYTEKGEKRHLLTKRRSMVPLIEEIIKRGADITIINESPDPVGDSIKAYKLIKSFTKT
ncbi:MAG: TIM barrel protein [Candidatus Omnitrophota bacterium]|jgi:deoxyribonuclease-4